MPCHGKHREEVSVSCLDQSWAHSLLQSEDGAPSATEKLPLSPPSVLILQNLCSADHPWLLPAAPVPSPAFC